MKVGIVMPTINLWEKYTKAAIDSAFVAMQVAIEKYPTGSHIHTEFLLIDNGSTDQTKDEAQKYGSALFTYHRNDERWGFQRSVNFGVKHFLDKEFEYVLVLNNDIVLHKDAIWRLVERFEKGGIGMATCLDITGESGGPQNVQELNSEEKVACEETPHPCFSAFMVNKECWDKVGEFDEAFYPAYFEDNDYHYRMQLAGVLAITYPPAMFYHYASRTVMEATPEIPAVIKHSQFENNKATYVRKWCDMPGKEVFKTPYNYHDESIKCTAQKPIV